jgi:hypothetical protein
MKEFAVKSLEEYIRVVRQVRHEWDERKPGDYTEIWFRGVTDERHLLLPGAYRYRDYDEWSMVLSFRAMAPMLVSSQPEDRWDWYYLMQHYGLPTRLLDWTESALHGLHFALADARGDTTPCVWILAPSALNRSMQGDAHDYVYVPFDSDGQIRLDPWLPRHLGAGSPDSRIQRLLRDGNFRDDSMPLAIYARRTNPRILAQRGVFTVHGMEAIPLEALPIVDRNGADRLARILVEPARASALREDLYLLGFSHTDTYPEPESIAKDLKRMYQCVPSV